MKYHLNVAIKETNSEKEYKLKYNDHYKMYKMLKNHYKLFNHNMYNGEQVQLRY